MYNSKEIRDPGKRGGEREEEGRKGQMEQRQELLARINQTGRRLSKGQKRIAEYIVNHYDKAAFMTASKLGDKVQAVSLRFVLISSFRFHLNGSL